MAKNSQKNRRDFLKATGTVVGVTSIAGCNSLGNGNDGSDSQGKEITGSGSNNKGTSRPTYELQSSNLEYDLTDFDASEANQHDKSYVEENYSSKLEVVAFKNSKEVDLEIQSHVHLEDEDAEEVATTDDGSVPEYAVRDGQELIVRAEIDGEIIEDTVSVNKNLPHDYDVILNIGEEVSLEEFMDSLDDVTLVEGGDHGGEVYLETQQGTQVEVTEYGTVPRDKIEEIEEGQELKLGTETGGELTDSATVVALNKTPRGVFIIDARLIENGETVLHHWDTPYRFDAEVGDPGRVTADNTYEVSRDQFHQLRAKRRDELEADEIIAESDLDTLEGAIDTISEERDFDQTQKIESYFRLLNVAMRGRSERYEGSGANPTAANVEKAMLDFSPYEPVYVGDLINPPEPVVLTSGDGGGVTVHSQLAYVDGDWYHVGRDNINATHIDDIEDLGMVEQTDDLDFPNASASELGVSVLGEFERGDTGIKDPDKAGGYVEAAVKAPVTSGVMRSKVDYSLIDALGGELNLSEDLSWSLLRSIRENSQWTETMAPIELAAAIQIDTEEAEVVGVEDDGSGNPQIKFH